MGDSKVGFLFVTGTIISALIGGSSTIGTTQFVFKHGMSVCWFTLGEIITCLLLLFLIHLLRKSGIVTLP